MFEAIVFAPNLVGLLVSNGVNVNAVNKLGYTPLYEAIKSIKPDVVKILLSDPKIIVNEENLEFAKEQHIAYNKKLDVALFKKYEVTTEIIRKYITEINNIIQMLTEHLSKYE